MLTMIEAEIDNIKTFIRESNPKTVNNTVLIDFKKVMSYSIKLSESILDNFLRTKELFNVAYESVTDKKVSMKFINIPKSEFVDIWKIRSSDVNKFIGITGYIRKATEIFHIPIVITYECKSCGAKIPVMQLEENITKPSKCQCLTGDTKVMTKNGYVKIKNIKKKIISVNHNGELVESKCKLIKTGVKRLWTINNSIKCSGNHLWFILKNNKCKIIPTEQIQKGDRLIKIKNEKMYNLWRNVFARSKNDKKNDQWRYENNGIKKNVMFEKMSSKTVKNGMGEIEVYKRKNKGNKEIIFRGKNWNKGIIRKIQYFEKHSFIKTKKRICNLKNITRASKAGYKSKKKYSQNKKRKSTLKVWREMWGSVLQKNSKRSKFGTMYFLQNKNKINNAPQGFESSESRSNKPLHTVQLMSHEVTRINKTCEKIDMYDLQVPGYNNFILENNIITHNCGCKSFTEYDRKLKDQQKVIIEEDILSIDPTQKPRRMMVLLEDDLCHEDIDKEIQPGRKVAITGILQEKSKDKKSLIQIKYLLGNHIKTVDDTINKVKLTKKDKEELLKQVSEKGFIKEVTEKIYGTIYGHDEIKDALLLQLLGGDHLYINDKLEERGNIHILLCSSPGTGKTKLAKCSLNYMPNSKFTSGTNSSGVGLIATVTKDEEIGGWSLESGILPMCEKSICVIDEMDKMSSEDMGKLNNAMADLCVDINKASIHATINTDVTILATANPKDRVFDVYDKIWKQIDLPKDFLDRFDLIFPMEAIKTEEHQRKIAHVLFDKYKQTNDSVKKIITNDSIMKYIAYARNCIKPVMSKIAQNKIEELYINLIKPSGSDEQAYMSTRLLTNVIRLATAAAKSRLSNTINEEDAQRAMDLLIYSLKKQEIIEDSVNGLKININKIENIVPRKTRNKSHAVMKIIKEIKNQETGLTKFEDMLSSYKLLTGEDEDSLTLVIEKLHLQGDIIEPKRGFYKALN